MNKKKRKFLPEPVRFIAVLLMLPVLAWLTFTWWLTHRRE